MEKRSMRRLVIGIMLALFAVGAYSQGDDMYVFQKSKKEKSTAMKSYMASLNIPSEDEVKEKVFKSFCGLWSGVDGTLVTISEEKVEIRGSLSFTATRKYKYKNYLDDILISDYDSSIIIYGLHYTWSHPLFGEYDENCSARIEILDLDKITLIITPQFTESERRRSYLGSKKLVLTRPK